MKTETVYLQFLKESKTLADAISCQDAASDNLSKIEKEEILIQFLEEKYSLSRVQSKMSIDLFNAMKAEDFIYNLRRFNLSDIIG